MRDARHNIRGFTMLELIIAMAMVAMLSATLYTSLNTAYTSKRSADRAIKPTRAVAVAADLIGRDLEGVVRHSRPNLDALNNGTTNGSGYLPDYSLGFYGDHSGGSSDRLQFCCVGSDGTPDLPLSEGIRQVELTVSTDDKNIPVLVRRVTRNLMPAVQQDPDEEIICRNVQSFTARYFDGNEWYDQWDSETILDSDGDPLVPTAVELTLALVVNPEEVKERLPAIVYTIRRVIPIPAGQAAPPQ